MSNQAILTASAAFILTVFLFVQFRKPDNAVIPSVMDVATYDGHLMRGNDRGLAINSVDGRDASIHGTDRVLQRKKATKREYTIKKGPKGESISLTKNTRRGTSKHPNAELLAREADLAKKQLAEKEALRDKDIEKELAYLRHKEEKERKAGILNLLKMKKDVLRKKAAVELLKNKQEKEAMRRKAEAAKKAKLLKERGMSAAKKLKLLKLKEALERKEEEARRRKLVNMLKLEKDRVLRDRKKVAAAKHKLHALLKLSKIRSTLKKRGYRYETKYPASCACRMVAKNSNSVCYYFLDKKQYICGRRQCGKSYVCVGGYTGLTCMRKISTEKVVPGGYGSGNYCKIKKHKKYYYVPYAYSRYR